MSIRRLENIKYEEKVETVTEQIKYIQHEGLIGFAENSKYLTLYGLTVFIIPKFLTIIFKEHLRNSLLTKSGNNKLLIIYTTLIFILIDISSPLSILNFKNIHDTFIFLALTLLPSITTNILATYINIKAGYQPIIIYLLILSNNSYQHFYHQVILVKSYFLQH